MPKRPRPKETPTTRRDQNNKPSPKAVPMPDPPPSLVQLLQKDPKALDYFKSLQTNLNYDVHRWKERALEYKKKYEDILNKSQVAISQSLEEECHSLEKTLSRKVEGVPVKTQRLKHKNVQLPSDMNHDKRKVKKRNENRDESGNGGSDDDDNDDSDAFDKDFFAALPSDDSSSSSSNSSLSSGSLLSLSERRDGKREEVVRNDNVIDLDIKISAEGLVDHDHGDNWNHVSEKQGMTEEENNKWKKCVVQDLCLVLDHLKQLGVSVVDIERKTRDFSSTNTASVQQINTTRSTLDVEDMLLSNSDEEKSSRNSDNDSDGDSDSSNDGFLKSITAVSMGESDKKEMKSVDDSSLKKDVTKLVLHRRSDDDIIFDLMRSLRSLIRMPTLEIQRDEFKDQSDIVERFQPFRTNDLRPVCYCTEDDYDDDKTDSGVGKTLIHPLVEGLSILINSLILMDQLCCTNSVYFSELGEGWHAMDDLLEVRKDDDHVEQMEKLESIRIGLINRNISDMIIDSLSGEITKHWTTIDRAARGDIQTFSEDIFATESDADDDATSDMDLGQNENDNSLLEIIRFNSKNQNKLFVLLERICLARILSSVYQSRRDYSSAAQVVIDYILGALPARGIEGHTSQAPVLSFLVLEALLKPLSNDHILWFSRALSALDDGENTLRNTLGYVLHSVADIWKQREKSSNSKFRGTSPAEVKAFKRLLESQKPWLSPSIDTVSYVTTIVEDIPDLSTSGSVGKMISLQLLLLWNGDLEKAKQYVESACFLCEQEKDDIVNVSLTTVSAVDSYVRLQQLQWEMRCLSGLSVALVKNLIYDNEWLDAQFDKMLLSYKNTDSNSSAGLEKLKLLCRWSSIMGDGARAFDLARYVCDRDAVPSVNTMRVLSLAAYYPVVRVVNLNGRKDRWKQFITQAQKSQLLVVLAVASIAYDFQDKQNSSLWGNHAHDGRDVGHLTFEEQVSPFLEKGKRLGDYVTTHWRPSDLRPFDIHARTDDSLVRTSVSERACSLSHISSWYGVRNSIFDNAFISDGERMLQLFRISGFASGDPFLRENKGMPPTPVCVILEDDAMLVDQFHDRLAKLLKELPRDFHFCSLGYSRPKNAPMIHYSKTLGIPTCFWYLTGYILSLEGAKYLINSLPVQGPVDSWIGMKATANWENEYGRLIGVGTAPKAKVHAQDLAFKRKLGDIVKFRVFAALSPLCSQKLAWKEDSSDLEKFGETAKWRQRDTDITFSGRR